MGTVHVNARVQKHCDALGSAGLRPANLGAQFEAEQAVSKRQAPALFAYRDWDKWNDQRTYFDKWATRAKEMVDL